MLLVEANVKFPAVRMAKSVLAAHGVRAATRAAHLDSVSNQIARTSRFIILAEGVNTFRRTFSPELSPSTLIKLVDMRQAEKKANGKATETSSKPKELINGNK